MPYGDYLYFTADDGVSGDEVWRLGPDGVPELVADVNPGSESSGVQSFFSHMGEAYFVGQSLNGRELYRLTYEDELELVEDINPGVASGSPRFFTPFGSSVFFTASDGERLNLYELDVNGEVDLAFASNPDGVSASGAPVVYNGAIYFQGGTEAEGTDLYRMNADGSVELAAEIREGAENSGTSNLLVFAGSLYFTANDGENGVELWRYSVAGGPEMVADINNGEDGSSPRNFVEFDGALYFTAEDDLAGRELFRVEPGGGPVQVTDINIGSGNGVTSTGVVHDGKLYFSGFSLSQGSELYWVNADRSVSSAGDFVPGPEGGLALRGVFGGELYLSIDTEALGRELFKLNSSGDIVLVEDIVPGENGSTPFELVTYNGQAYFRASASAPVIVEDNTERDAEVHVLTPGGDVSMLDDIKPGLAGSLPSQLTVLNIAVDDGPDTPTEAADNFVGSDRADAIGLLGGNDFYAGLDGDDVIIGGDGADTLIGGRGNDVLDGGTNPALQGDFLLGGDGDDQYIVDSPFDFVDEGTIFPKFGFGGSDTIVSATDFFWDLYSVAETFQISEAVADPEGDGTTAVAGIFDNLIIGNSKTNVLFGRGGSDTYRAGDGIDFISLSTLGLTEENAYAGVDGVNTILVEERSSGPNSYDIVFEFESGKDRLDVSDYGFASQEEAFATGVDDGIGNAYFILGDGFDYLYMVGLELAELGASDFVVA